MFGNRDGRVRTHAEYLGSTMEIESHAPLN